MRSFFPGCGTARKMLAPMQTMRILWLFLLLILRRRHNAVAGACATPLASETSAPKTWLNWHLQWLIKSLWEPIQLLPVSCFATHHSSGTECAGLGPSCFHEALQLSCFHGTVDTKDHFLDSQKMSEVQLLAPKLELRLLKKCAPTSATQICFVFFVYRLVLPVKSIFDILFINNQWGIITIKYKLLGKKTTPFQEFKRLLMLVFGQSQKCWAFQVTGVAFQQLVEDPQPWRAFP